MGERGRGIVELDVKALIAELRKSYLDELLAFYSYWITAQVAEGFHGEELTEHFAEDATEELGHAQKLAARIMELGGDPVVPPKEWEASANHRWIAPRRDRSDAEGMIQDQIRAERDAIEAYNRIAKMTFGKDPVTYSLATELLQEEVQHEEFLENLLGGRGARGAAGAGRRRTTRR